MEVLSDYSLGNLISQALFLMTLLLVLAAFLYLIKDLLEKNVNPYEKFIWLTLIFFLPLIGIIMYTAFGRRKLIEKESRYEVS
ncbi:MAG: PLD nuclease N-terminal domain-containing protein [Flavobacteriaceae bacterium]